MTLYRLYYKSPHKSHAKLCVLICFYCILVCLYVYNLAADQISCVIVDWTCSEVTNILKGL